MMLVLASLASIVPFAAGDDDDDGLGVVPWARITPAQRQAMLDYVTDNTKDPSYKRSWWTGDNCTSFISNAILAAGFINYDLFSSATGYTSSDTRDSQWYYFDPTYPGYAAPWSGALSLRLYMDMHQWSPVPWNSPEPTPSAWPGNPTAGLVTTEIYYGAPSSLNGHLGARSLDVLPGDIIFFGGGASHAAMITTGSATRATALDTIRFASHTAGGIYSIATWNSPGTVISIYRILGYFPVDGDVTPDTYSQGSCYLRTTETRTMTVRNDTNTGYESSTRNMVITIQGYDAGGKLGYCTDINKAYNGNPTLTDTGFDAYTDQKLYTALSYGLYDRGKTGEMNSKLCLPDGVADALEDETEAYYVTQMGIWYALGQLNYTAGSGGNITLGSYTVQVNPNANAAAASRVLRAAKKLFDVIEDKASDVEVALLPYKAPAFSVSPASITSAAFNAPLDAYIVGPYTVSSTYTPPYPGSTAANVPPYIADPVTQFDVSITASSGPVSGSVGTWDGTEWTDKTTGFAFGSSDSFWVKVPAFSGSVSVTLQAGADEIELGPLLKKYNPASADHNAGALQGILTTEAQEPEAPECTAQLDLTKGGSLSIRKTTENNEGIVTGFTFKVYRITSVKVGETWEEVKTLIGTYTTVTSDGMILIPDLCEGLYEVEEIELPNFVPLAAGLNPVRVNVSSGTEPASVTFHNVKRQVGSLEIVKTVDDGGSVAGFQFEVRDGGDALIGTYTTDATGRLVIPNLAAGTYWVKEINIPAGYIVDTTAYPNPRSVTVSLGQTAIVTFSNLQKYGVITVRKTNGNPNMGDYPLGGAKFEVRANQVFYAADGFTVLYQIGDLVEEITTDASGVAVTAVRLPLGDYTIQESYAPPNYVINSTVYHRTVTDPGTAAAISYPADVDVAEAPQVGQIEITKLDLADRPPTTPPPAADGTVLQAPYGGATLNGATFKIYANEDIRKQDGSFIYHANDLVATVTCGTASNTCTYGPLPLGRYYVVEDTPPTGYLLNTTPVYVTLEYGGQTQSVVTGYATVYNQIIMGQISITKYINTSKPYDAQAKTELAGAVFEIYLKSAGSYAAADPDERDLLTTDSNGYAITKSLPYGLYTVHEKSVPAGLDVKLLDDFDVMISADGTVIRYRLLNKNFNSEIKIVKIDATTKKTILVANACFKIWDVAEQAYVMQGGTDEFFTDASGTILLTDPLWSGNYELEEIMAPGGYLLAGARVPFTVHSTQANPLLMTVTMENDPAMGKIELTKTGGALTGATRSESEFGMIYTPVYASGVLAGAVFDIVAAEDIVTPDGTVRHRKDAVVGTLTTNASGEAASGALFLGKYLLVEKTAPAGFAPMAPIPVTLTYKDQLTAVVTEARALENQRLVTEIELQKQMEGANNADALSDVVFGLFAGADIKAGEEVVIPKDALVGLITPGQDGKGSFKGTLPPGSYYVKELRTNKDYQLNDMKFTVVVGTASKLPVNQGQAIVNKKTTTDPPPSDPPPTVPPKLPPLIPLPIPLLSGIPLPIPLPCLKLPQRPGTDTVKAEIPKTGDSMTSVLLPLALLLLSMGAMAVTVYRRKKETIW